MAQTKFITSIVDNINVYYFEQFIESAFADQFLELMENEMIYNSDEDSKVCVFGKYYKIPRKQVAYGDKGIKYNFAGSTVQAKDWNNHNKICEYLRIIRDKIEILTKKKFNFVLINRYKDGYDCIGSHSDDEKDLGKDPDIVGINFGAERKIVFKSKKNTCLLPKTISLRLKHGSLYIMNHPTNIYWKHSIPKELAITKVRISLTFRNMI